MMRRKNQSDASDISTTTRRGWGPFSGGQLTAIILGVVIAIAFPVGAWAVSGTTVFVTDSVSGKTAAVNSLRQLAISGTVSASEVSPNSTVHRPSQFSVASSCGQVMNAVPTGKAMAITGVDVVNIGGTPPTRVQFAVGTESSPCSIAGALAAVTLDSGLAAVHYRFDTPLVLKAGHVLDLAPFNTAGNPVVGASVQGYYVSSTQCTITASSPSFAGCF